MAIDETVNSEFIRIELPILKSLRRHYQKMYNMDEKTAIRYSIINYADQIRNWYTHKYMEYKTNSKVL